MDFLHDISSLGKLSNVKFNVVGSKLPGLNDLYFRSKQQELIEQYSAARIFLNETETTDWNHWFKLTENETANKGFQLIMKSHFYETALLYYNVVIDLSWVLCYVSAECVCNSTGTNLNISGITDIEKAMALLRDAEKKVQTPTAKKNPFADLKMMCPEFVPAIDLIVDFWEKLNQTDIRNKYNFCKHRGRPAYNEIEELKGRRILDIYYTDKATSQTVQCASDIRDVQYSFSLDEAIKELLNFDNTALFPYIQQLITTLETVLKPSPWIM